MYIIRRNADIEELLKNFSEIAEWDGKKHYFTFSIPNYSGILTVMKYPDDSFTIYFKNDLHSYLNERSIDEKKLVDVLWKSRKWMNKILRSVQCV